MKAIKVTRLDLRDRNACWYDDEINTYFGKRKWISLLTLLNAPQMGPKAIDEGDKAWLASQFLPLEQKVTICQWFDSHPECLNSESPSYQEARAKHILFEMLAFCPWTGQYRKKRVEMIDLAKELIK